MELWNSCNYSIYMPSNKKKHMELSLERRWNQPKNALIPKF